MEKTQLLKIELGEELTKEFASYWMGRKISNDVPIELDIDPIEQKDGDSSIFTLAEEISVTTATADPSITSDLIRIFLKQLVFFIKNTFENKNPQQIRITLGDTTYEVNTGTITYMMIEELATHHQ